MIVAICYVFYDVCFAHWFRALLSTCAQCTHLTIIMFFFFFPSNFYFKKIWFVNLFSHLPMLNFEFFLLIFFIDLLSAFVSFMLGYFFFLHLILFEYHLFIPLTSNWVFPNIFCSIIPLITNILYLII